MRSYNEYVPSDWSEPLILSTDSMCTHSLNNSSETSGEDSEFKTTKQREGICDEFNTQYIA